MAPRATRTQSTTPRNSKIGFVNRTQGILGVVKIDRKGNEKGQPVFPGETVYLTPEEVELTEQSHTRPDASPFKVRTITHYNPQTGDQVEQFEAAPLEKVK